MSTPARDRGIDAHRTAVKHLDACDELADAWDAGDLDAETPNGARVDEVVTAGLYCGCRDCEVREALSAMWPHALAHAADLVEASVALTVDDRRTAALLLRGEARRATLAGQDVPA